MWVGAAVASAFFLSVGFAVAAEQERGQQRVAAETQGQEQIYGSQLMTEQERAEYQAKMRAAKTAEERERIRTEHHEQMEVRAKERGMTLSDEPPMKGGGMGPGHGGGKP
jgi:hypothetical protein